VVGLLLLSAPVAAAPPGNQTSYNVDVGANFDVPEVGNINFEGHGNDPDGWPDVMEFWITLENGCSYHQQNQPFTDNGDTLTISLDAVTTDCFTTLIATLIIDYDAVRYRSHTNETGGQQKVVGVRDDSADVSISVGQSGDGAHFDAEVNNVAFYQAATQQFHNTGNQGTHSHSESWGMIRGSSPAEQPPDQTSIATAAP
jgi:hypothetical protein